MRYERPDITRALIHLTGDRIKSNGMTAENALYSIMAEGKINGSNSTGFIKGSATASCFSEIPLSSLSSFIANHGGKHKYDKYGIAVSKQQAWGQGARPVIYLPDDEGAWIPETEKWRHVQFNFPKVDFTHEREWRCKGDFSFAGIGIYVIVPDKTHEDKIRESGGVAFDNNNVLGFLHLDTLNDLL